MTEECCHFVRAPRESQGMLASLGATPGFRGGPEAGGGPGERRSRTIMWGLWQDAQLNSQRSSHSALRTDTVDLREARMPDWTRGAWVGIHEEHTRVRCSGPVTIYQAVTGQGWGAGGHKLLRLVDGGPLPELPLPDVEGPLTMGVMKGKKAGKEEKRVSDNREATRGHRPPENLSTSCRHSKQYFSLILFIFLI